MVMKQAMYLFDFTRLKKCIRRAAQGEELTLGFLGGSITQGSCAQVHENTYAYRVFSWWEHTFPEAEFHYVNGGIGGTTSHYGAARAVTDVLMYQPDFVVVDFSVNDEADTFFQETYEGVVRECLSWPSMPAVILLNNVFYDTGENAQEYHNAVGEWYHLPYVSIRDTVYQRMKAGEDAPADKAKRTQTGMDRGTSDRYTREDLTPDGLHPNDRGHGLVAGEIIRLLESVKEEVLTKGMPSDDTGKGEAIDEEFCAKDSSAETLPAPMTANAYEHARRLTIREISPRLAGFRADTEEKTGHLDAFKNGWIGKKAGDRIFFEVEASCIAVQYRKSIVKPALSARAVLDGDVKEAVLLDGEFDEDWGDCQYLQVLLHHGTRKKYTIEIEVLPGKAETAVPFYLMAMIIA